ncbi:MAG: response regulator [Chloroflexota bacterium]
MAPFEQIPNNASSGEGEGPSGGSSVTVLVVDDEPSVLAITARLVERMGHRALTAESGVQAIEIVRSGERLDCILLDLTMPQLSGAEALRLIREVRPEIPVVLMSGYSAEDLALRPDEASRLSFLRKPFSSAELRQALAQCLGAAG